MHPQEPSFPKPMNPRALRPVVFICTFTLLLPAWFLSTTKFAVPNAEVKSHYCNTFNKHFGNFPKNKDKAKVSMECETLDFSFTFQCFVLYPYGLHALP